MGNRTHHDIYKNALCWDTFLWNHMSITGLNHCKISNAGKIVQNRGGWFICADSLSFIISHLLVVHINVKHNKINQLPVRRFTFSLSLCAPLPFLSLSKASNYCRNTKPNISNRHIIIFAVRSRGNSLLKNHYHLNGASSSKCFSISSHRISR